MKEETLLTLKDIENVCANEHPFYFAAMETCKDDLRKEAIKWIKGLNSVDSKENFWKAHWIKHFFNITDEDLK